MRLSDECRLGEHIGKPGGCTGRDEYRHPCECGCHDAPCTVEAGPEIGKPVPRTVEEVLASGPPATIELAAELLRAVALSRAAYLPGMSVATGRDELAAEVHTLRRAAAIIEGDLDPLYGLLHSFDWTTAMHAQLDNPPTPEDPDAHS